MGMLGQGLVTLLVTTLFTRDQPFAIVVGMLGRG